MKYKKLLGAYRDSEGTIYKLHPMVKMLLVFCFVIAAGIVSSAVWLAVLAGVYIMLSLAAGLKLKEMFLTLRPFRFLLAFTFVVQLFLTPTGGWVMPDMLSLERASFFTSRMMIIIAFSSIFAIITPPTDIVRIFYVLFQPLRIFMIKPADMAMSMLIALRFIPLLFTEGEKIVDSQRLKGILPLKGEKRSIKQTVVSAVSLVVPLFVRTFHYAGQIAVTLNYRNRGKDFFRMGRIGIGDMLVLLTVIVSAAGVSIASKIS